MRHFHAHDAAYIEALTGQSWLAVELIECRHLYKVPLPYLDRIGSGRINIFASWLGHCLIRKRLRGTM